MNEKTVDPRKLSSAILTLHKEVPDFRISTETSVRSIIEGYISHEEIKACERATSGLFVNPDEAE